MKIGDTINVTYQNDEDLSFCLDETVIDFIYDNYWAEQEDGTIFDSTIGILVFPQRGEVPNTWLTREGFLVRTADDEPYLKFTQKYLDIVEYDEKYDFIMAKVADDVPDNMRIDQTESKDNLIHYLINSNKSLLSPLPEREEYKRVPADLLTMLHRIEGIRAESVVNGTAGRQELLEVCSVMSYMLGDGSDFDYYKARLGYIKGLISFARSEFAQITPFDRRGLDGQRILEMDVMILILMQYGKAEESEIIDATINDLPDTVISAVAKLIQAANRFIGTQSLQQLRADLHREICVVLGVSDSILAEDEAEETFPFRPEGEDIEHKMSWVIDNETGIFNETSQSSKCMKTVCAFMNRYAEQGEAHLYIGTDEKRHQVRGFQSDIEKLIQKGEIKAAGDVEDEYMRKIVMGKIRDRFPDTYQNVTPKICCDGKVLDLCVQPAKEGVVYLNGVAYYRSGSESKVMTATIEEEMRNRKFLLRNGMADKIDAVRRAINIGHTVCLVGYDSSSSNTSDKDRKVEAFAFADDKRCDALWAFDPKDKKNKVFLLRRADAVKVLDENWKWKKFHAVSELDIFGFSGNLQIPLDMVLKTTRAKNQFIDLYPSASDCFRKTEGEGWRVKATLYNSLSLDAACSFYLSISDDVDISASAELKRKVTERIEKIVAAI